MRMPRCAAIVALAVVLVVLTGCGAATPSTGTPGVAAVEPRVEPTDCQFEVPPGPRVECGTLELPEDRRRPDGASIRLHVATFRSTSPDPAPDPVIHLHGGPGGSLLDLADFYLGAGGSRILESRDYVMFTQRGTRHASPFLDCPGQVALLRELAERGVGYGERQERIGESLLACHEALRDQGINLAAYNSTESAADIDDLRQALGYDQVNLYGISYGARLALTAMREHPSAVRSAIIDSGYPMQVDIGVEFAFSAARAFELVFERCANDPVCAEVFPGLEATFYRVVDRLNADPARVALRDGPVSITGDDVMDLVFGSLYTLYGPEGVTAIPTMIAAADQGRLDDLAPALEHLFAEDHFSEGLYYSILCREEMPVDSYDSIRAMAARLPDQLRDHYLAPTMSTVCGAWDSGRIARADKEPVVSDIPSLILTGEFDPITPPAYSRTIAETLSTSYYREIAGIGHGVMRGSPCALTIGLQFLDDPTSRPDDSCAG